jgi:hypothetical protein
MSDERKIKWLIYIQLAETNSGHNFTKMIFSFMMFLLNHLSFIMFLQGWIQHDLVGGCSASSGAELCWSCVPPAHQLASLLQSLASLQYLNCNCCSQFAYHHIITQITVSHFVSDTFLLYLVGATSYTVALP